MVKILFIDVAKRWNSSVVLRRDKRSARNRDTGLNISWKTYPFDRTLIQLQGLLFFIFAFFKLFILWYTFCSAIIIRRQLIVSNHRCFNRTALCLVHNYVVRTYFFFLFCYSLKIPSCNKIRKRKRKHMWHISWF